MFSIRRRASAALFGILLVLAPACWAEAAPEPPSPEPVPAPAPGRVRIRRPRARLFSAEGAAWGGATALPLAAPRLLLPPLTASLQTPPPVTELVEGVSLPLLLALTLGAGFQLSASSGPLIVAELSYEAIGLAAMFLPQAHPTFALEARLYPFDWDLRPFLAAGFSLGGASGFRLQIGLDYRIGSLHLFAELGLGGLSFSHFDLGAAAQAFVGAGWTLFGGK